MHIALHQSLTDDDIELILVWLREPRSIRMDQWPAALSAFDRLGQSTLAVDHATLSFPAFYRQVVGERFAEPFLQALGKIPHPEATAERERARVAREILHDLDAHGLISGAGLPGQLLAAYCLYWWHAWTKGVSMEVAVYRDLDASGIAYHSHDLLDAGERYSHHDLEVLGRRGDIRTSTYFLFASRTAALPHDFYLTRVYDLPRRTYLWAVVLKEPVWQELDGDPIPGRWRDITRMWPQPVRVVAGPTRLIVVPYDEWKHRVLALQEQRKDSR